MINQTVRLSGLTCGACIKLTQMRLRRLRGVGAVEVEASGLTRLRGEHLITKEEIEQALAGTPYGVTQMEEVK